MNAEQVLNLKIGISPVDDIAVLKVETAIEWLVDNTTVDTSDIESLPAAAKLFISKFVEINSINNGVASENIEGLSLSYKSDKSEDLIWDIANQLLGSYLKSRIRFVAAERKWL